MDVPGLQVDEHIDFQRRYWKVERVAWVCFGLFVVIASLGLLGGVGPLSDTHAASNGLRVEYGRFERMQSPLSLRVRAESATAGVARLWLSRDYVDDVTIERVVPEPRVVTAREDGVEFEFASTPSPLDVLIEGKASRPGVIRGAARVGDATVEFSQFVYP